ncbi:MAG: hypothetical protein HY805_05345 [Nitrospirae bacterium]|nr:hypothetical protein [Nitrospirota bacterium]
MEVDVGVTMKGKKVLVFGLQKSGVCATNLLLSLGADVTVTDKKSKEELMEFIKMLSPSAKQMLGGHPEDMHDIDLIVVSPGVPMGIEPLGKARAKGIKTIGELELAYRVVGERIPFYAVTGTNGKSTTTSLLNLMLQKAGKNTILGGNIGNAITGEHDDPETLKALKGDIRSKVFFFSRLHEVKGVYLKGNGIYYDMPIGKGFLMSLDDIAIKGVHNLENAMAGSAMALLAGCHADAIRQALREFRGLPHRLEFVRELNGVTFVNDSKGTNVGAVLKSLESFSNPIVLIAGGRDKAGDFTTLRDLVRERVKALVLIGEAKEKIRSALGDIVPCMLENDMSSAVKLSKEIADRGDVVLLSPACTSFDMFRDFEDRGERFKEAVWRL